MIFLGSAPKPAACRAGLLWVLAAAGARAQPAPLERVLVDFEAPPGCPSQTLFEGAMLFRSQRIGIVTTAEQATVTASVRITAVDGGGYQGVLALAARDGTPTERSIGGLHCATVVEALSLSAVLLLDPEGARSAPLPTASELESLAEQARAAAEPPDAAGTVAPAPSVPTPPPKAPPAPAPEKPEPEARHHLGFMVSGGVTTAIHGVDAQLGAGAELGYRTGPYELSGRLAGAAWQKQRVTSEAGSVTYVPVEVRAGGCIGGRPELVELDVCLDVSWFLLSVDAPETDEPHPSLRHLPGVTLSPRLAYRWGALAIGAEIGGGLHFSAERFRIEPDGEAFRLPRIYGRSMLFLRLDLPLGEGDRDPTSPLPG